MPSQHPAESPFVLPSRSPRVRSPTSPTPVRPSFCPAVPPTSTRKSTDRSAIPPPRPADQARENVDELLLQDAHNLYKPILAVCFGCQILNVWRSGTLVQDLTPMPVNHQAGPGVAIAHTAALAPNSLLASILVPPGSPEADRIPINSSHHQAIGIPGDGLRVSARCPQDGVVEAIEGGQFNSVHTSTPGHPAHFVLGVQWHPERNFTSDPNSQALFRRLTKEALAWTPRPILTSIAS